MTHAFQAESLVLFCPQCRSQHEDLGVWASRPHRTHLCMFCKHEWTPFPYTTVGIALPRPKGQRHGSIVVPIEIFESMHEYSATLPTGPESGRYWRARYPYYSLDRAASHSLCVALATPQDRPGEISLIWRSLIVSEWVAGDALSLLLAAA